MVSVKNDVQQQLPTSEFFLPEIRRLHSLNSTLLSPSRFTFREESERDGLQLLDGNFSFLVGFVVHSPELLKGFDVQRSQTAVAYEKT